MKPQLKNYRKVIFIVIALFIASSLIIPIQASEKNKGETLAETNSEKITALLGDISLNGNGEFEGKFLNELQKEINITKVSLKNKKLSASCEGTVSKKLIKPGENFTVRAEGCNNGKEIKEEQDYDLEVYISYKKANQNQKQIVELKGPYHVREDPIKEKITLLLTLALALLLAKIMGEGIERIGQPAVIGEILAGLVLLIIAHQILGPHLGIGISESLLKHLGEIGILFLLFLTGLEVNLQQLKQTGVLASGVAIGGAIFSFGGGLALGLGLYQNFEIGLWLGALLVATSVGVTARILLEAKALDTRAGSTIVGAAVIDDVLGIVSLIIVLSIALTGGVNIVDLGILALKIAAFFFITFFLGLKFIEPLANFFDRFSTEKSFLLLCIVLGLLFAAFAESLKLAGIVGTFIAGLILGETPYKRRLTEELESLGYGLLIPIFFVWIGTQISLDLSILGNTLIILVAALVTKMVGCFIPAKLKGSSWRESTIISLGMVPRLEIGLVVATLGMNYGLGPAKYAEDIFSIGVFISLATGVIPLFFLRKLVNDYLIKEVGVTEEKEPESTLEEGPEEPEDIEISKEESDAEKQTQENKNQEE